MQKILLIVQARLGSTRLPQKVLRPILKKPMLTHLVERLGRVTTPHQLIIATTKKSEDTRLARYAEGLGLQVFRGESDDVLDRYYQAAKKYQGEIIVRITADCPLMPPRLIDEMLLVYQEKPCDYLSNVHPRSFPKGFDLEIFSFKALEKAHLGAKEPFEKEHVTPFFHMHPELFSLQNFTCEKDCSFLNVSIDTLDDFYWVEKLYEKYYEKNPLFGLTELLEFAVHEPSFSNRLVAKAT